MEFILMIFPVIFLVSSVIIAIRAVHSGAKTQKAVAIQMLSFFFVCILYLITPIISLAASDPSNATETIRNTVSNNAQGMGLLASALVTGLSGIGGGIAVAASAPAAIGATSENPKTFTKALIFVALGEGIALYGLLVSILILSHI